MKLSNKDKKYLRDIGHTDMDFNQIENASRYTKYEFFNVNDESIVTKISQKQAIEILGRETFLSGLGRSAFHSSAVRYNSDDTIAVVFDSSRYLN